MDDVPSIDTTRVVAPVLFMRQLKPKWSIRDFTQQISMKHFVFSKTRLNSSKLIKKKIKNILDQI